MEKLKDELDFTEEMRTTVLSLNFVRREKISRIVEQQ